MKIFEYFLKKYLVCFVLKWFFWWKNIFYVKVWWKFGESFTETFSGHVKLSWKFQMKLSLMYESFMKLSSPCESFMKISWNFQLYMKVSWKFHETFLCGWKFHLKLSWKFHMPTESFSESFTKLSANFHMPTFWTAKFLQTHLKIFIFLNQKTHFFLEKKAKPSALIPILSETYCFNWINIGIPRLPTGLKYVVVWLKIESSEGAKCT